jgi:UDP-glucose 4-epimerase
VGKNQTHGVGLDFIRNLLADSSKLRILGDGNQSKSYIHIDDLMNAVLLVSDLSTVQFDVYNVSNDDQVSVKEIASLSLKTMNLDEQSVRFEFGSTDRGWAGDVPIVILDSDKLMKLGWRYRWNSKQAMGLALESIWHELKSH